VTASAQTSSLRFLRDVAFSTPFRVAGPSIFEPLEDAMYDIYVNDRNILLVVPRGARFPSEEKGAWRKKRVVRTVSDRISEDILRRGYHLRKLSVRPISTYPRAAE
jgi:hypothetical protein